MPTRERHLQQARHNEQLYQHLAAVAPAYIDWQITALLYAALHYVDAYLATRDIHPTSHDVRGRLLAIESELRRVYVNYQDLENRSRDARYELSPIRPGYEQTLYASQFVAVRDHLLTLV